MIVYALGYNRFKQLIDKDVSCVWKSEKLDLTLYQNINDGLFSCSWYSMMLVKNQKLHVIGHGDGWCGCSIHIACIENIARFSENVKCILNLGDHVGLLNDLGQFSLFKITCQINTDSTFKADESRPGSNCTCTLSTVLACESNAQLAACNFNGCKILLIDDFGKRTTITKCNNSQAFTVVVGPELPIKEKIKQISCGNDHCLALTFSGRIYSWGIGSRGQLGHGDLAPRDHPSLVVALDGVPMRKVVSGGWHSVALADTNDLYVWGWNESGQTGFPAKNSFSSLANQETELGNACAANSKKSNFDELPNSNVSNFANNTAEAIGMLLAPELLELERYLAAGKNDFLSVIDVACGSRHTVAVLSTGDALSWGWGKYGQLGQACCANNGTTTRTCKTGAHLPDLVKVDGNIVQVYCASWNTFLFPNTKK